MKLIRDMTDEEGCALMVHQRTAFLKYDREQLMRTVVECRTRAFQSQLIEESRDPDVACEDPTCLRIHPASDHADNLGQYL